MRRDRSHAIGEYVTVSFDVIDDLRLLGRDLDRVKRRRMSCIHENIFTLCLCSFRSMPSLRILSPVHCNASILVLCTNLPIHLFTVEQNDKAVILDDLTSLLSSFVPLSDAIPSLSLTNDKAMCVGRSPVESTSAFVQLTRIVASELVKH